MCKIKDDIDILLDKDKTKIATSIKLLARMADNRFSEIEKKNNEILEKLNDLSLLSFLCKHKIIFWLALAGMIFLLGNGILDTIRLFLIP